MKTNRNLSIDDRFWQLLALANEANECAVADLRHEYGFVHEVDDLPEQEAEDE